MQETQVINNALWFILLFFAGATIPLPSLPGWIQNFALFLPGTYVVTGFQRVMIDNASVWTLGEKAASLITCGLLAFFLSVQLFRWDPDDKVPRKAKLWAAATALPFVLLGLWENSQGTLLLQSQSAYYQVQHPDRYNQSPSQDRAPSSPTDPPDKSQKPF